MDCDEDGEPECNGFCAVAYRFKVIDECVPPGDLYYNITTPSVEGTEWMAGEGLGHASTVVEDTGDSCLSGSSDCSVAGAGRATGPLLALLMVAVGGVALLLSRRRSTSRLLPPDGGMGE